ncbi:class I SAM-dependent methyltransferase [Almyronema epifaneia]|uniref:Class I SAM-dependent methyltransferase n=1 Tax=Almyronema epifaneia S1 TaxID=2991925 RepID=A0ABW6II23_9CYAN
MNSFSAQDPLSAPLYQQNPLDRFSQRADDYARYRPSYPTAAIADVLAELSPPIRAADIGAGTGIAARLLAEAGAQVIAIEPNAAMQQAAIPHPLVTYQTATAEATGLMRGSLDLVTCFQSFHWFHPEASLQEFHRILRPAGRLALVWNDRDESDAFTAAYSQMVRQATGNRYPHHEHRRALDVVEASPLLGSFRHHTYAYRQALNLTALLGRCRSSSYVPQQGEAYQQLVAELKHLYEDFAGDRDRIDLFYTTHVYLAETQPA